MTEFSLIFRNPVMTGAQPSPQQMQDVMKQWQDWFGSIGAQNKIASMGNRLGSEGKTVKPNNLVTDGPYVEIKEFISGYIIVKTENIDEAVELAKSCPILYIGGNVEVRKVVGMNDNS